MPTPGRYIDVAPQDWSQTSGTAPLAVTHGLGGDPLLDLEPIAELAASLPADLVEHNYGQLPLVLGGRERERPDAPASEVVRNVSELGCWIVLKKIDHDPAYRALVDECLMSVAPSLGPIASPMHERFGYLFVSARHAITPAHMDFEHNFLLQAHGTKIMTVGQFPTDEARQRKLEERDGQDRYVDFLPTSPMRFELEPGRGVYVPPAAPHFVEVGEGLSISLSVTWRSDALIREERVHRFNRRLRTIHAHPAPPGTYPRRDDAKATAAQLWESIRGRRGDITA